MEQEIFQLSYLQAIVPELLLLVVGLLLLGVDLVLPEARKRELSVWAAVGFAIVALASPLAYLGEPQFVFGGMIGSEPLNAIFAFIFAMAAFLVALLSRDDERLEPSGVYYALIAFAVIGMDLMVAATDFIMLYLALELTGLSLYLLSAYDRRSRFSVEAGMKYFFYGSVASAVMLYGITFIAGLTGQTLYLGVRYLFASAVMPAWFGMGVLVLILAGVGFKVAMVPLHTWAPDVYEGAPTPVTAFLSVTSKAAGVMALMRLLVWIWGSLPSHAEMTSLIAALAIVTITLGNLFALRQKSFKRLLAYSSITQAGYVLVGVTALSPMGLTAVGFYLAIYAVTNIAAFTVLVLVSNRSGSDWLRDFVGLQQRSPALALALLVALLSLGGVPPFAGFVGKILLFAAALKSGFVWLVGAALANVLISLYYYLNAVRMAYTRAEEPVEPLSIPVASRWVLVIATAGIILGTVLAYPLYHLLERAAMVWF